MACSNLGRYNSVNLLLLRNKSYNCGIILALTSPTNTWNITWLDTSAAPHATTTTTATTIATTTNAANKSLTKSTITSSTAGHSTTEIALSVVTAISLVACIGMASLLCWCKRLRGKGILENGL